MSGDLPLRTRIDIDALARRLSLSSMPVRQALALLLWERLLCAGARGGYEVALWSERELADLFAWRGDLMALSLTHAPPLTELRTIAATQPYAQAVWNVMRACDRNANSELIRAALGVDERLHLARLVEEEVLADAQAELETLVAAIGARTQHAGALVKAYHQRRALHARALRQRAVLHALPANGA